MSDTKRPPGLKSIFENHKKLYEERGWGPPPEVGPLFGHSLLDSTGPYWRVSLPPRGVMRFDRGPWLDLTPEAVSADTLLLNDGPIRGILHDLGLHKHFWESATPDRRALIKRAAAMVSELEAAFWEVVNPKADSRSRNRSRAFLVRVVKLLESEKSSKKGYARSRGRNFKMLKANDLLPPLLQRLKRAKTESLASSKDLLADEVWKRETVADLNKILRDSSFYSLEPRCTEKDLADLLSSAPSAIARRLLKGSLGLSEDDLKRTAPPRR